MKHSPTRRALLLTAASLSFTGACSSRPVKAGATARDRLAALEAATGGRLGVAALNTADGARIDHRPDERFPFGSTFKVLAAAAILKRSASESDLLQRRIVYAKDELVTYSPITGTHVDAGMTLAELCAAALQHSDNTAANLLLKMLGGPAAVTEFARAIGDEASRLNRWETALNTALPGDPRDTTTPAAMAGNLHRLLLGDALGRAERERLTSWMLGNTTGAARIRAGVPGDWRVADKTGTADYGTTNDVAVVWPPGRPPSCLPSISRSATGTHRRATMSLQRQRNCAQLRPECSGVFRLPSAISVCPAMNRVQSHEHSMRKAAMLNGDAFTRLNPHRRSQPFALRAWKQGLP